MQSRAPQPGAGNAEVPLTAKVAFLSAPGTYADARDLAVRETHMAWVFLAGDRVYKLKKPVRYPFLDYETIEARRHVCAEEVRLNRRLAPDIYLGVSRLTVGADDTLAIDGNGRTVDWLVVMRRLPDALLLDHAIAAGTATPAAIEAVADRLSAFYTMLEPAEIDPGAYVSRFLRTLSDSLHVFTAGTFGQTGAHGATIVHRLEALLAGNPALLIDRVDERRIVEGHGDLRPEHVCLSDPPVMIDCLEFSRELRLVDPFDELAFLGMECAVLGADWVRTTLLGRCVERLGDSPPDRLLAFYTAFRACLRARQSLAHLLEPEVRTPAKWIPLAESYLHEADAALLSSRPPAARPASDPREGTG